MNKSDGDSLEYLDEKARKKPKKKKNKNAQNNLEADSGPSSKDTNVITPRTYNFTNPNVLIAPMPKAQQYTNNPYQQNQYHQQQQRQDLQQLQLQQQHQQLFLLK